MITESDFIPEHDRLKQFLAIAEVKLSAQPANEQLLGIKATLEGLIHPAPGTPSTGKDQIDQILEIIESELAEF